MSSNNQTTQDYSDSPMDQTGNIFAPLDNNNELNIQHTSINDVGMSNTAVNTATPATSQNIAYEFYFHLPNDTRIYRVTYSELHPSENIRLLNNGINLSHIPDHQFPHHYNIQSQIQQQIQQQAQQPVYYQQNGIQQQSFDTMMIQPNLPTLQVYSDNNVYSTVSTSVNGAISDNTQDTRFQNSS